jgi:hypothetical protein
MAEVISIITKKHLGVQDTAANDKVAEEGIYLGCLPKLDAIGIRQVQSILAIKQQQINELIEIFNTEHKDYLDAVCSVLVFFEASEEDFDPAKDKLMVGEDGHTWIAKS